MLLSIQIIFTLFIVRVNIIKRNNIQNRFYDINRSNDDPLEENSATDLASMSITIINESENPRRNNHYLNVSSVNSNSKISKSPTNEINRTGTKNDSHHCIDLLATRILQLLVKVTMVASDRLISQLISKKVLNLNVLTQFFF